MIPKSGPDRRNFLQMGAAAAAFAAAPVGGAATAQDDPILARWVEREAAEAALERACKVYDRAFEAGRDDAERLYDEQGPIGQRLVEVEAKIAALEPVSPEGWHKQALLLESYIVIGPAMDDSGEVLAARFVEYFRRMAEAGRPA